MPQAYVAIRESYKKRHPGMPMKTVKKHAAKIYNATAQGQSNPVGRYTHKRKKGRMM